MEDSYVLTPNGEIKFDPNAPNNTVFPLISTDGNFSSNNFMPPDLLPFSGPYGQNNELSISNDKLAVNMAGYNQITQMQPQMNIAQQPQLADIQLDPNLTPTQQTTNYTTTHTIEPPLKKQRITEQPQPPADVTITRLQLLRSGRYTKEIKSIETSLQHICHSIANCNLQGVSNALNHAKAQLHRVSSDLNLIEDNEFVEPIEFKALEQLRQHITAYLSPQVSLYGQDLDHLERRIPGDQRTSVPVYLAITQDSAGVVSAAKPLGDICLKLVTSARVSHISTGYIRPELNATQNNKRKNKELEKNEKTFNNEGRAIFKDLKFPSGTFPNLVNVDFGVQAQYTIDGVSLTEDLTIQSKPFISVTNTNAQFVRASGLWLKKDCFQDAMEITIARFWNYFQKHYLKITKQDVHDVKRPLFLTEFNYILKTNFGQGIDTKKVITQPEFQKLWEWVGPALKKIRFQPKLLWLFENGYLIAFITGKESEDILNRQHDGTFLIRLSQRLKGQLIISYKRGTVRHYLVKNDDTNDKKKTLIDFLGTKEAWVDILQMSMAANGERNFAFDSKDNAFCQFYKPASEVSEKNRNFDNPYDETVVQTEADTTRKRKRSHHRNY